MANSKRTISQSLLNAATAAVFNSNKWKPVGEPVSLKDLWAITAPGTFEQIDTVEVTMATFADGSMGKRLTVTLKDGDSFDLKCFAESDLMEGDLVDPNTIYAQELKKLGQANIVRFNGSPLAE